MTHDAMRSTYKSDAVSASKNWRRKKNYYNGFGFVDGIGDESDGEIRAAGGPDGIAVSHDISDVADRLSRNREFESRG